MDRDIRGSRALVTGAAGMVGANLVRALLGQGAEVHVFIRPSTNLWRLNDILPQLHMHSLDLVQRSRVVGEVQAICPDYIFHLATERSTPECPDDERLIRGTVIGTLNLLNAVSSLGFKRFVHTGSSLEYGQKRKPMKETDNLEPITLFGTAKASSTILALQFAHSHGYPLTALRLFSVYGYWEAPKRLIPIAVRAALRGDEIPLTAPGYRHDFIFVKDVVEAYLQALHVDEANGEVINVASGEQTSNEELVEMIEEIVGQPLRIKRGLYPAREWDTPNWVGDINKAREVLGWEPQHTLRQGLTQTVDWLRQHVDRYGLGE